MLDKIYALAYSLVIAAIMEAIATAGWAKTGNPEDYARIIRLDRPFLAIQCAVLILGGWLILLV